VQVTDQDQLLHRGLTRWHALAVVIGSIVGTGIYIRPASIAQLVGSPSIVLVVWICAGLLSLAGALTYAQLAALIPRSGGEYAFLRTTLGELPAFLFGWMRLTVSVGTCAAMAVAVTVFLSDLVPLGLPWVHLRVPWPHSPLLIDLGLRQVLAVLILGSLAILNLRGVGHAGRFQAGVTTLKVIGLFGLIVGVFVWGHAASTFVPSHGTSVLTPVGSSAFSAALLGAMVAFNGWANVAMLAGEVKSAERTVPWALLWGILAVIGLYLLVNAAYLYVLPMRDILTANSAAHPTASSVASRAALAALGPRAGVLLPVLFMVSALGTLHCNLMAVPRVFYAMARDGLMPAALGRVDPTARTPAASILTVAFVGAILALVGSYDRLSSMATFGNLLFFALNAWGLIRWGSGNGRSSKFKLRRSIPWIFLAGSVWLLVTVIAGGSVEIVWALAVVAAGVPVYLGIRRARRDV
jgi:basic amino acid/polyamine antiporter, APA family